VNITILCSSQDHPVWPRLAAWCERMRPHHQTSLVTTAAEVGSGDLLLLISCSEIIRRPTRSRFGKVLVIHASDVPFGRGFAPLNWQIIEGKSEVVVTLMEAADKVDSGDVWAKQTMRFEGHELFNEIFEKLFETELNLMDFAVENFHSVIPVPQPPIEGSYYRRRVPEDNHIEPHQTIEQIFDLARVSDPHRYPLHFDYRGQRYALTLRKLHGSPQQAER
jgi:methionyl-tRNA formyltransferase